MSSAIPSFQKLQFFYSFLSHLELICNEQNSSAVRNKEHVLFPTMALWRSRSKTSHYWWIRTVQAHCLQTVRKEMTEMGLLWDLTPMAIFTNLLLLVWKESNPSYKYIQDVFKTKRKSIIKCAWMDSQSWTIQTPIVFTRSSGNICCPFPKYY